MGRNWGGIWGAKREEENGGMGAKLEGRGSEEQNRNRSLGREVDLGTFLQDGDREAEMRQRLEKGKMSCWKISAVQSWAGTHPRGLSSCPQGLQDKIPTPGQKLEFPKRERAQPGPVPVPMAWELRQPPHPPSQRIWLPQLVPCSRIWKIWGLQPWDLRGLREMGIFLLLCELKGMCWDAGNRLPG